MDPMSSRAISGKISEMNDSLETHKTSSQKALSGALDDINGRIRELKVKLPKLEEMAKASHGAKKDLKVTEAKSEIAALEKEEKKLSTMLDRGKNITKTSDYSSYSKKVVSQLRLSAEVLGKESNPIKDRLIGHVKNMNDVISRANSQMLKTVSDIKKLVETQTRSITKETPKSSEKFITYKNLETKTAGLAKLLTTPKESLTQKAPDLLQATKSLASSVQAFEADVVKTEVIVGNFKNEFNKYLFKGAALAKINDPMGEDFNNLDPKTKTSISNDIQTIFKNADNEYLSLINKYAGKTHTDSSLLEMKSQMNKIKDKMIGEFEVKKNLVDALTKSDPELGRIERLTTSLPSMDGIPAKVKESMKNDLSNLTAKAQKELVNVSNKYSGKAQTKETIAKMKADFKQVTDRLASDVKLREDFHLQLSEAGSDISGTKDDLEDMTFLSSNSRKTINDGLAKVITETEKEYLKILSKFAGKSKPEDIEKRDRDLSTLMDKFHDDVQVRRGIVGDLTDVEESLAGVAHDVGDNDDILYDTFEAVDDNFRNDGKDLVSKFQQSYTNIVNKYSHSSNGEDILNRNRELADLKNKLDSDVALRQNFVGFIGAVSTFVNDDIPEVTGKVTDPRVKNYISHQLSELTKKDGFFKILKKYEGKTKPLDIVNRDIEIKQLKSGFIEKYNKEIIKYNNLSALSDGLYGTLPQMQEPEVEETEPTRNPLQDVFAPVEVGDNVHQEQSLEDLARYNKIQGNQPAASANVEERAADLLDMEEDEDLEVEEAPPPPALSELLDMEEEDRDERDGII